MALALTSAGCGRAAAPADGIAAQTTPAAAAALCVPAAAGRLVAKLQGAIEAEIEWSAPQVPQCLGGPRPAGDGVRLIYKGMVNGEPLLVVIGVSGLTQGASQRNLPANLTLVREGTSVFYATQGDDKCALDSVQQVAVAGSPHRFQLTGRGYCTQPARALANVGAVFVSRFDLEAIIDYPEVSKE